MLVIIDSKRRTSQREYENGGLSKTRITFLATLAKLVAETKS
jgi:hypothetical protein